jgi:hypothetical protein
MSDYLKQFLSKGGKILDDTKEPGIKKSIAKVAPLGTQAPEDPHKAFIDRCIQERPKKIDIVEDLKRFVKIEDAKL